MDWPKAKTTLIIGFLLLDLYLAYLLFFVPGSQALPTSLEVSGFYKLREVTNHYNYSLMSEPVPMDTSPLPVLEANVKLFSQQQLDEIVLKWLGELVAGEGLANGSTAYSVRERFLYLGQDGALRYEDRALALTPMELSREQALKLFNTFAQTYINPEELQAYQQTLIVQQEDGSWLLEFNRQLYGAPVFADKLRAEVADGRIRRFETRLGLATKGSWLAARSRLVTADRAVLRFLAQQGKPRESTVEIIDVRLGYDFANADKQELIPVWRVMINQPGEDYIVPAGVRYWRSGGP